jgi:DNA-binding beta-propeller fold protein YncE
LRHAKSLLHRVARLAIAMLAGALAGGATAQSVIPVIGSNFTGSTYKFNAGNPPPDSMGAAGPRHFVEFVNSRYAVYDKDTGKLVRESTLDAFWQASWPGQSVLANPYMASFPFSAAFDPRILYDAARGRWYAIADNSMELLVAVSNTSDPTQGWRGYQVDDHAVLEFDAPMTATLLDELDTANHGAACDATAPCEVMRALQAGGLVFDATTQNLHRLVFRTIEPHRRWAVICQFPPGYCNWNTRLIRNEQNRFRVYKWATGGNIDFPTLGMDADNLYVATQFNDDPFFVIPKDRLQSGTPPTLTGVTVRRPPWPHNVSSGFGAAQPIVDLDGNRAARALIAEAQVFGTCGTAAGSACMRFRRIPSLGCDHAVSASCDLAGQVPLKYYDYPFGFAYASQPGGNRVGPNGPVEGSATHAIVADESYLSSNVVLRNGQVHGVQLVLDQDVPRLRYFRIRARYDAATDAFAFDLLDDLLVPVPAGSPTLNAFYGSVAVNASGQVVLGFSGSRRAASASSYAGNQFASSYAVAGTVDGTGHMVFGNPILLKAGNAEYELGAEALEPSSTGRNRFGDYSATTVDPADPSRFWTIQEFVSAVDVWSTQISEIRLLPAAAAPRAPRVSASAAARSGQPAGTLALDNVAVDDVLGSLDKGRALENGDFVIAPNLSIGARYTADTLPLGDGREEVTYGSFNFGEDAAYARFRHFAQPRPASLLPYAEFEIVLTAGGDCAHDTLTLGNLSLPLSRLLPGLAAGCAAGDRYWARANLLDWFTSGDLLDAVAAKAHALGLTYGSTAAHGSNAIVTYASLSLGTPDLLVIGHGPAGPGFQQAPLRYDGQAGAYVGRFGAACNARDMAYGPDGRLYVLDDDSAAFGVCDAQNLVSRMDGITGVFDPVADEHANYIPSGSLAGVRAEGMTFGPDGNLYVAIAGLGTGAPGGVVRFQGPLGAHPGAPIGPFVALGSGGLKDPTRLRFGPDGALYVANAFDSSVLRYDGRTGAFIDRFVTAGHGGLHFPSDLAFGSDGDLFVAGELSRNVIRYAGPASASAGQLIGTFARTTGSPTGLAFGPGGDLFVSETPLGVFRYDRASGAAKGQFAGVRSLASGVGPLLFSSTPAAPATLGDFDASNCVDTADLAVLMDAIRRGVRDARFDLTGDGVVNVQDARKLTLLFTNAAGAPCS